MVKRYRRYYRRRRYYRSKKKWTSYSAEIVANAAGGNLAGSSFIEGVTAGVYGSSNSLGNGAIAQNPVSAIDYYVCRTRFKGVLGGTITAGLSYIVYIGYVPNAVTVNNNVQQNQQLYASFFYKHPEYILAWNRLDYIGNTGDTGEISLYSRVARRIAPGDQVVVGVLIKNETNNQVATVAITGTFSCYLRTN